MEGRVSAANSRSRTRARYGLFMSVGRAASFLAPLFALCVAAAPLAYGDTRAATRARGSVTLPVTRVTAAPRATPAARPAPAPRPRRDLGRGQLIDGRCASAGLRRCLSFTFDDGPEHRYTSRLLDTLDAHGVKATFFVVGHRLDGADSYHTANRAILRETARRGHRIGNHTYHHVVLDGLRPDGLATEIDRTAELIQQSIGQRPALFRAPFGLLQRQRTVDAVASRGYTPAYWELDTMDWSVHTTDEVVENFRRLLRTQPDGGVVLLHDTHWWSVNAVPQILGLVERRNAALVAAGEEPYRIVGLDAFYRPLARGEALRGMPEHRHHRRHHEDSDAGVTAGR